LYWTENRDNHEFSGWAKILREITQGSVLGLFLSIRFINNLVEKKINYLFADDAKVYCNILDDNF